MHICIMHIQITLQVTIVNEDTQSEVAKSSMYRIILLNLLVLLQDWQARQPIGIKLMCGCQVNMISAEIEHNIPTPKRRIVKKLFMMTPLLFHCFYVPFKASCECIKHFVSSQSDQTPCCRRPSGRPSARGVSAGPPPLQRSHRSRPGASLRPGGSAAPRRCLGEIF